MADAAENSRIIEEKAAGMLKQRERAAQEKHKKKSKIAKWAVKAKDPDEPTKPRQALAVEILISISADTLRKA